MFGTLWSTKVVEETIDKIRKGVKTDMSCFYEKNTDLKNSNILYQLTQEEESEFVKCSVDIVYFVEQYCKFLTDTGLKTVDLRDYQSDILDTLGKETWIEGIDDYGPEVRNFILMSSRQTGKCFTFNGLVKIKNKTTGNVFEIEIGKFFIIMSQLNSNLSFKQKVINKIKRILYSISISKLKIIVLYLINLLEKWENSDRDILQKLIDSYDIEDYDIWTDTGWETVSSIHQTKPFIPYQIVLENGYSLEGANEHICFDENMNQRYIIDLKRGDYIQTDAGVQKVLTLKKLGDKPINMYDITVNSPNHRFYSNGILSHNTTTIAAFFAWYLCFHMDRNLAILANKEKTTKEIVRKVLQVFRGLPFFLKPGIKSFGALGMELDNGCMLTSQATTKTSSIGFTIHVLYIDEFAHINKNIAGEFWRSVYPTLSSSLISQAIITSTPNGMDNLFFDVWDKSQKGENSFVSKRVDYWEVPGHDDEWARKLKADFGEDYFAQEYELKFDLSHNLLLDGAQLAWLKRISNNFKYSYNELEKSDLDTDLYKGKLSWINVFDPNDDFNVTNDRFMVTIDIAEGEEAGDNTKTDKDYNVAEIYKIRPKSLAQLRTLRKDQHQIRNMFNIIEVGLYRDRENDEEIMAKVVQAIVFEQFGVDLSKVLVEMNFNGKNFVNKFSDSDDYYEGIMMHSYHTKPVPGEKAPKRKVGFKVGRDKEHYCKLGKKIIRQKTLVPTDKTTKDEFNVFGKTPKGKWKGLSKHDDTVMACLNISRFYDEPEYEDWLYDFLEDLPNSPEKKYIMELLEQPQDDNENISDDEFNNLYMNEDTAAGINLDLKKEFNIPEEVYKYLNK